MDYLAYYTSYYNPRFLGYRRVLQSNRDREVVDLRYLRVGCTAGWMGIEPRSFPFARSARSLTTLSLIQFPSKRICCPRFARSKMLRAGWE